ncbi:MAG: hypothetical protein N3D85_01975 [Candidatus Bathyarchaeota archaeon]|nr:hypothetical protein [Candidatus Bathyarchaeota archaeon]
MRLKSLEEKYLVKTGVKEASELVQKALGEIGLKNVIIKKHVPPRYLLVEYTPSWVGKALEIEFLFKESERGTEIEVKWPYTREVPSKTETPEVFRKYQEEMKKITDSIISDFKMKINAIES